MSSLDEFLSNLSDRDLSVFIAYRFDSFLETSREKIRKEIQRRGLDREELVTLYKEGLPIPDEPGYYCPQCHSQYIFTEQDHEMRSRRYSSYEVIIETKRCQLCGYNPDKRKPRNLLDALRMKLGGKGKVRLAAPSESVYRNWLS